MNNDPFNETTKTALQEGKIELQGQFLLGSNYTFLVKVHHQDTTYQAVYKPMRGEQPLWDFPASSLAGREVAACLVSRALGWDFVPLTALRDGPFGPGSIQIFINYNPDYHYFTFSEADRQRLRPVAVFDLVVNNADRKGSHILVDQENRLWLIDHGLCFHEVDKLRTVIWDFAGERIPAGLLASLEGFLTALSSQSDLPASLAPCLSPPELAALVRRVKALLAVPVFPFPPEDRRVFPWPPL